MRTCTVCFPMKIVEVFADMSCFHLPWTEQVQYPHTFLILMVITCGFYYMNGGSKEEESLLVVTLPELQSSKLFPKVLRHHCPNYPLSHRRLLGLLPTFAFKSPVYTTWELLWSCCMGVFWIKQKVLIWTAVFDWSARILGAMVWTPDLLQKKICPTSLKMLRNKGLNNSLYLHRLRSPTNPG